MNVTDIKEIIDLGDGVSIKPHSSGIEYSICACDRLIVLLWIHPDNYHIAKLTSPTNRTISKEYDLSKKKDQESFRKTIYKLWEENYKNYRGLIMIYTLPFVIFFFAAIFNAMKEER